MFNAQKVKESLTKRARRGLWDSDAESLASEVMAEFNIAGSSPPEWLVKMARKAIDQALNEESAIVYDKDWGWP